MARAHKDPCASPTCPQYFCAQARAERAANIGAMIEPWKARAEVAEARAKDLENTPTIRHTTEILSNATEHAKKTEAAEAAAFVACYKAVLALAKLLLAKTNAEDKAAGREREWPAQQEWSDMVSSSHSIFLRRAREESGIDHAWFAAMVAKHIEHVDGIYREAASGE